MSIQKENLSVSTAATSTMMSSSTESNKITSSGMESILKDKKVDKLIKLETLIQYIEQIKRKPIEEYMTETRLFLSKLILEFEGDKEYYLPWVRFLDIAYAHKMNKLLGEEEEAFKRGVEEILTKILLKDKKAKRLDWRIARKVLSLKVQFSVLDNDDVKRLEEGTLKAFKAEIDIALEHLLWQEESLFVASSKETLICLRQCFDSQDQNDLIEAIVCGRFDKDRFTLKNSLIMGEDGGLFLLLNRMNQQQKEALIAAQVVTKEYLKDKIKPKEDDKDKDDRIVLGAGGFGTVKFALSLLRGRSLPAEIVCIKKTRSFQDLGAGIGQSPLKLNTESTLGDYFTNDRAQAIYSPCILDLALVTSKSVIKDDVNDHRKGYLMMEILPQNTATRVFANERYQKWEYQKPYLLDVLENTQKLLESNIAMTDMKPDNTLYDIDTRKATIIDLGGSVKVASSQDLLAFDITKYQFQSTPQYIAPELSGEQGIVSMHKALAYICGKVVEEVTQKSDYDQKAISQIVKKLTASEPQARIFLPEAITEIKGMGDDSYRKDIIFSHYINKVKDRLENKKSAIGINEDIDKTRELLITLNSTSLDPSKYKNLKTENLYKKIDDFLAPGNGKQVMAIFGIAGSGKSIALQLKFIQAVYAWKSGQPLPIYFNLTNGIDLNQILRTLNAELDTNLSLDGLDGQHFYIDSFDEGLGIEHKRETLIKEYFKQLGSPKVLITCRTDYLQDSSSDWFRTELKEPEVCYVTPIDYNGHQNLSGMVGKYVDYTKKQSSVQQHTIQEYLDRLKELQLIDLLNTGFMFFLVMEVLFKLQDKKEGRITKVDIYASYVSNYQNSQAANLKNPDQKKRLAEMILSSKGNPQSDSLCSFATELGKHLACQMHLMNQARLGESDKLFAALGYDNSLLFKHQTITHMLKLLPLKIVTTHSGKRQISNQEIKIGFIHDTIKNYYLLEAIKSEVEKEGKSVILASRSIVKDNELMRLIVLAMQDHPKLITSFLNAIENSKRDKSTASIINASNSISLLVAAKHSFSGCDLSNIAVKGASIVNGIFHNAKLDNADFSDVDMSNVNLTGASLNNADMRGVNFSIFPDLVEHTDEVNSVSFSPDSNFLVSGAGDNSIKIWNPSTGQCIKTLNGHDSLVRSVSISPDSKFLASGSDGGMVKVWNLSTGECLHTLRTVDESLGVDRYFYEVCVSFSPDGKSLAIGSRDGAIKFWNPSTGEYLHTLDEHTDQVKSLSFSPDGKFLSSASNDQTIIIWNLSTNELLHTLNGHTDTVHSVLFSPDGKFLASGSSDDSIKIWNSNTGECLQTLNGHTSSVQSVYFSPDSRLLASGSYDETVKIWNPSTGECLQTLTGHTLRVNSVSFSPDGKFLVSGSADNSIKIWNSNASECLQTLNLDAHTDWVKSVRFSPDSKFIVSGSDDQTIKIWNLSTGECHHTLKGHDHQLRSVNFSPDGKFLASGSVDKSIKIWNPSTRECLQTLNGHTDSVMSICISPDGKLLASGSGDEGDNTMKIWNLSTGECLQTINGHNIIEVKPYNISPDDMYIIYQNGLKMKIKDPEELQKFRDEREVKKTSTVSSVSFSPDGKFLASGSFDKKIKIWNPNTSECLQTLNGHTRAVKSVSFSPDSQFLASGSSDESIKIWNLSTGECLQTLNGHIKDVHSISFSPGGKFLASGSKDNTIKIWNPSTGECLQTLNSHNKEVIDVSFSPDGKFLASGSEDNTINVYELEAKRSIWLLKTTFTSFPSPLFAEGATLVKTKISSNNKRLLEQKGVDTTSSNVVIDNTTSEIENYRNPSPESKSTANQLSQAFLEKFIVHQQSQNLKLVIFSITPDENLQDSKLATPSGNLPNPEIVANTRSTSCCQLF